MPTAHANGIRLYYEQHGAGAPIVCIHGTGSSAVVWGEAIAKLASLGWVIAYDRRGHSRSERPELYLRTSVAEHADDAAALLESLGAAPAVVIGRSYGGVVATDLALRYPESVRALVLLEPAELEIATAAADWCRALGDRLAEVAESEGVDAVGEAMISDALGEETWESLPQELQQIFTHNGPAILAEELGEYLRADAAALKTIEQPVLLVGAEDSVPVLQQVIEVMAEALPGARTSLVSGGHLIDPADPEVRSFIVEVLGDS